MNNDPSQADGPAHGTPAVAVTDPVQVDSAALIEGLPGRRSVGGRDTQVVVCVRWVRPNVLGSRWRATRWLASCFRA